MRYYDLIEASEKKKPATTNRTIGFEFEIATSKREMTDEEIGIEVEEYIDNSNYSLNNYFDEYYGDAREIQNLIEDHNLEPKYGWFNLKEYQEEKEEDYPELFDYLRKTQEMSEETLEEKHKKVKRYAAFTKAYNRGLNIRDVEPNITVQINKDNIDFLLGQYKKDEFNQPPEKIEEGESEEWIKDESGEPIHIIELNFDEFEDYFNDVEDLYERMREEYHEYMVELAYNEISNEKDQDFEDAAEYVQRLAEETYDLKDIEVKIEEGLGPELVTPVYNNVEQGLENLKTILEMIREDETLYTENGYGLHVNIGTWHDISQLDVLKLMLFIGEKHILNLFNRLNNPNTKSLIKNLKEGLQSKERVKDFDNIKRQLNEILLQNTDHLSFIDFGKLTRNGYIELRGLGNKDYEYKEKEIIKVIKNVLRVLEIAEDPNLLVNEYIKKLTKLVGEEEPVDRFNTDLFNNQEAKEITSKFGYNAVTWEFLNISEDTNPKEMSSRFMKFVSRIVLDLNSDNKLNNNILRSILKSYKFIKKHGGEIDSYDYDFILNNHSQKLSWLFQNYIGEK